MEEIEESVEKRHYPLTFTGNGSEYAKIFFVNIALTIVTLGIYSAWAKVRNKRYFYGNTQLNDHTFDYHAQPLQILKGRLLVIGLFVLYQVAVSMQPLLAIPIGIIFLLLIPVIIINALKFSMHNTSYQQIRFNYQSHYGETFFNFIFLPFIGMITAGLAYPYAYFKQRQFLAKKVGYGATTFAFFGQAKAYYWIFFQVFLLLVGLFFVGSFVIGFLAGYLGSQLQEVDLNQTVGLINIFLPLAIITLELLAIVYFLVRTTNYWYNNLALDNVTFNSTLTVRKLLWIYIQNTVLIVLTLGIFTPWAMVRTTQYRVSCITVEADELDHFVAGNKPKSSALGEESGEFMDIDVGL
jgi:uncharacterized membrane protein YjgN (DUF898 family)